MHFRTRGTGAEAVHLAGMAGGFESFGHRVEFSSPTGVDPRRTAGSNPWSGNPGRVPRPLFEAMEIAYNGIALLRNYRRLRRGSFGMVYERHAFFLGSTPILARHFHLPLVVEVNELVGDERIREQPHLRGVAEFSDRYLFRRADLVATVSSHLRRRVIGCGVPEEKVLVLPNAVPEALAKQPADGVAVRERLGLGGVVVIGFVGWLTHWHRFDLLIEAFAALEPVRNRLKLLLIADGDRAPVQDLARRAGVLEQVLITGAVPHGEIPGHIAACDLCVVPNSNDYRSPIKLFEYMGQGRAVVAPSLEPIRSVVEHGENGLLFEPLSAESMARQLRALVDSEALRAKLGEAARMKILADHTWERNAGKVLAALGRLFGQSREFGL